jgi:uncharacterized small protein (DUF1192 family)
MALTTSDLDRLKSALASNVLETEEDGVRIRFGSVEDLQKRIAAVEADIAAQAATTSGQRQATRYYKFSLSRER